MDSLCLIAKVDGVPGANETPGRRHLQDVDPVINVQRITFIEVDRGGEMMAIDDDNDYTEGPYYDGQEFSFSSVSSMLNTSLPLVDQTQNPTLVPGGATLILYGETESGSVYRNRIWWTYQMDNCTRDTDPVQAFNSAGWVTVSDVSSAWPAFCKRAIGSPTIPPQSTTSAPSASPQIGGNPFPPDTGDANATTMEPTLKRTRPPRPTEAPTSPNPTFSPKPTLSMKPLNEPCLEYLVSKSAKSKSSKSTKSCKSGKSWSEPHSMSWGALPWGVRGKVRKEGRPNRIYTTSRIKFNSYEDMSAKDKTYSSQQATSQLFAPAWELLSMFVLAAALMGWRFRHELFPYASREVEVTQQATGEDIVDMSDDEEDIDEPEEMSTSEETEHIGDAVFNRTLQLISSSFDGEVEAGGGNVGFVEEDETSQVEDDVDLQQQAHTFEGRVLGFI